MNWSESIAYAEDSSIICNANEKSAQDVFDIFIQFEKLTGLKLNSNKTGLIPIDVNYNEIFRTLY